MTLTMMRPERDHVAWSISPEGTVWLADLDRPRLHELTIAGDTLRTLDVPWEGPSELDISPRPRAQIEASGIAPPLDM